MPSAVRDEFLAARTNLTVDNCRRCDRRSNLVDDYVVEIHPICPELVPRHNRHLTPASARIRGAYIPVAETWRSFGLAAVSRAPTYDRSPLSAIRLH